MQTVTPPSELFSRLQAALGTQYVLERELGHGGMGVVFLARDTTLDRPVAVKVVHPELAVHQSITERFLAEARMIARLRHPSIVAVHSAGETTGLFYYVMDYVPGESLRQRLLRDGKLPVAEVIRIVADLADGLHAAGTAGLVHRDVKPENVLLDAATGRAMLADFGIARAMVTDPNSSRTGQGVAVGTPTYMSPEQAAGEQVDSRSDLYALGVVAFEMLAGRPPFRSESAAGVASMHLAERPTPVGTLRADVPASLAHAVMRALEKDPAVRWQNGADMRLAVLGAAPPAVPARRGRRGRLVGIGLAAMALVAVVLVLALRPSGPPAGVNPRHSILVLPFDNLRDDPAVQWMRDGSVSMLALNLSQWRDLTVVDHERLHDLLERRSVSADAPIGLDMARRLARDAGVWTVVLGDYTRVGDSLQLVARVYDVASGTRLELAQVEGRPGDDVRPLFDRLAARLLNLSGAPTGVTADLARVTTPSLEAYRSYLYGIDQLNGWNLVSAEQAFRHAVDLDSTFGLAYYKLSLTRGWISGQQDSLGLDAIHRATRFAESLPDHDRGMIDAYRLFLEGDFGKGQAAYRMLLGKDSTDADAWYGLADVNFHDPVPATMAGRMTTSLRAFKRAIALDPDYYLAYEHLAQIYRWAAADKPFIALLPGDSLALTSNGGPRAGLDATTLAESIRRARDIGVGSTRDWLAHQPENVHAQNAMILALDAGKLYDRALAEVDRLAGDPSGSWRPDLPFLRARVLADQGEYREAMKTVARAVDTLTVADFDNRRLPGDAITELTTSANLLGMAGRIGGARQALQLATDVSARWFPERVGSQKVGDRSLLGQLYQSHLLTAMGAPADELRPIWQAIADSARKAPRTARSTVASFGWVAALGLYLQDPSNPTPLDELAALDGYPRPIELRALVALGKGDSAGARRLLQTPEDSLTALKYMNRGQWFGFRQMVAAQTWHELHDDTRALKSLEGFEAGSLSTEGPDVRWFLLGQARMLRGEIYEQQGRRDLARAEYQAALTQLQDADSILNPLLDRVRLRLAKVTAAG